MSTQAENIKHEILTICDLWVSSTSVIERVSKLLDMLENASHEHSFDNGYETGYDKGWIDGHEMGSYSSD